MLKEPDALWFCALYALTFGGFVGFTSFLTTFFNEQYHVSKVSAGDFTTLVVVAGSLLRPVGGWLSDRIGGYRLLLGLLMVVASALAVASTLPPLPAVIAILFVALGCLGMGNGAVFQLVPQRFADRMGLVTGIVGAAGGLGGFFLPSMLGAIKDSTGSYGPGLLLLAAGVRRRRAGPAPSRLGVDQPLAAGYRQPFGGVLLSHSWSGRGAADRRKLTSGLGVASAFRRKPA